MRNRQLTIDNRQQTKDEDGGQKILGTSGTWNLKRAQRAQRRGGTHEKNIFAGDDPGAWIYILQFGRARGCQQWATGLGKLIPILCSVSGSFGRRQLR